MKYAVLIVNFNTARFVAQAVESVLRCATADDFTITIVDNNSVESDLLLLRQIKHPRVCIRELNCNGGFAVGYNTAAKFAAQDFRPDFLIVMNPDVQLLAKGSIETLIHAVEQSEVSVVGAQPLIDNYRLPGKPAEQISIRRVPDFWDLFIAESVILRYVCVKRIKRFRMDDARPYGRHTRFSVPSGAFFLIRAQAFWSVGGFDENTFLYGEEQILGKKLQMHDKCFMFEPSVTVQHFHAAATEMDRFRPNRRMYKYARDSHLYYAQEYLEAGRLKRRLLFAASELGYIIRYVASLVLSARRFFETLSERRS